VKNNIQQRAVDLQSTFYTASIMNETQFPEPVHEKTHSRSGGSNHIGQGFLAYLGNHGLRHSLFSKMGEQERTRASRFSLELNNWSTRSSS